MRHLSLLAALLLAATLPAVAPGASAQLITFGSAEDPLELHGAALARPVRRAQLVGGLSFLAPQWHGSAGAEAEGAAGRFSFGLGGLVRAEFDGTRYAPDASEPYDFARIVRYVRVNPRPGFPLYARVGPTRHVTLGSGALAEAFAGDADPDEFPVGAEAAVAGTRGRLNLFTDDLRFGQSVVGGYGALRPFAASRLPVQRGLSLGVGAVHDLGLRGGAQTTAVQVDVRTRIGSEGDLALRPWASYAEYLEYGRGGGVGIDLAADDLVGAGRARLRAGIWYAGKRFIPGYFGPFYAVANPGARIIAADPYFADGRARVPVDRRLTDAPGGLSTEVGFEAAIFESLVVDAHTRFDFSSASLNTSRFRIAARPAGVDGLLVSFALYRQGLKNVGSLFTSLDDDQNRLVLDLEYPLPGAFRLLVRSRYGYARLANDDATGERRYLVQRRFEPMIAPPSRLLAAHAQTVTPARRHRRIARRSAAPARATRAARRPSAAPPAAADARAR